MYSFILSISLSLSRQLLKHTDVTLSQHAPRQRGTCSSTTAAAVPPTSSRVCGATVRAFARARRPSPTCRDCCAMCATSTSTRATGASWRCTSALGEWRVARGEWQAARGEWRVTLGVWRLARGEWRVVLGEWWVALAEVATNSRYVTEPSGVGTGVMAYGVI